MSGPDADPPRYRFGPLERRGLVAGWRGGQITAVAGGLLVALAVLRASSSPAGVALALLCVAGGLAAATWPVAGRTVEEWTPDALRHVGVRCNRSRGVSPAFRALDLIELDLAPSADPPATRGRSGPAPPLSPTPRRGSVGVVCDRTRRTYSAALSVSAAGFVLAGEADKARRVAQWSGVLASMARDNSTVYRLQWVERVLPPPPALTSDADRTPGSGGDGAPPRIVPAPGDGGPDPTGAAPEAARRSYDALMAAEAGAAWRHEVLLVVTVRAGRGRRAVRSAGGDAAPCAALVREVAALRRRLADASVDAGPVLDRAGLAAVIRRSFDDGPPPAPAAGTSGSWPWPMGVSAEWGRLRTDGTWQATFWISEWPRVDVGPDFLAPLVLAGDVRRTLAVVMEPVGPIEAARKVEQARTADIADAELRRRGGFLSTARRGRERELLARREVELADGHGQYRFSGYLTVTADGPDRLEQDCGRVEQAAARAGLELRRCYGDQAGTFLCTLPTGRGLS